ncbi:short-chain fatty acyl-CoA regulator family protein [Comamonas kerstersii]|uniref:Cro/Cl family transcriptional regulator n=1 Tax=Comamonas kerstersii TaxID=225992 RepID=A0A0W7YW10_9BURK|nr:short-chain fatty acyl-CoA regulator family protein [Comamonas kerstersii]AQZ98536.1 Cro/Cl family transcriptional regulator [Comamonas kerstersii]KUF39256.1 Cro/Cl family transcriptional regulator [Comamonas kerstersii]OOH86587.1 Cro/Cl family transcriptional regulator [Comamonas kerstersii]OOH92573.1 Cro/Cl family transcriptional regulator [Comamonas kerstersii]
MSKIFMGVRLRSLRQERGLTQAALAKALDLSSSYLNQIEQDQRPLTVPVLLKINKVLGVDIQLFSEDEEARVLTQLKDALSVLPPELAAVPMAELRAITSKLPHVAKAMLALHQRYVASTEQIELLAAHANGESVPLSDEAKTSGRALAAVPPQMPYEAVRDFFFARRNYFDALDCAAESLAAQAREHGDNVVEWLKQRLQASHALRVVPMDAARDKEELSYRYFEAKTRVLYIAQHLRPGQQAFHMATQLALLEFEQHIEQELQAADWQDVATQRLARIGLANYVAGAFLLPYRRFLAAAERVQYDVDVLARQFDVGFETVCHRLSTLQRPEAPGVPFFFVRVDRAGNISKRQSATHFHFSKTGGTCPLWVVYEAFQRPGEVVPQLASMPDGRMYFWIARTVTTPGKRWGAPKKTFSIGLGCDVRHAHRLIYAKGLDLRRTDAATPIGMGCKVCERPACPQRAFPHIGKPLQVSENESGLIPYVSACPSGQGVST